MKNVARVKKKKKKESVVSEGIVDKNLCYYCENLAICSFVKSSKKPVLSCEEYSDGVASKAPEPVYIVQETPDDNDELATYIGLCATCENYRHCILRRQEGGVWRCNEYR